MNRRMNAESICDVIRQKFPEAGTQRAVFPVTQNGQKEILAKVHGLRAAIAS